MKTLQIKIKDGVAVVTLSRGRSNPINLEMIAELKQVMQDIEADDAVGGVIITGSEGFFSAGIDLVEAYSYNEEQSMELWSGFLNLQSVMVAFKKPMVAAISGHSPAGGCVLALCCDYRVMASGKFIIGLNEIPVGIIVPGEIFNLYSFWIGKRKAYQYLLEGKLLSVEVAYADGLIDEICDPADVLAAAEKKITAYMRLNPVTWRQSKLNLRQELLPAPDTDQTATLNLMLKQWWAPETRKTLQAIIENLKSSSLKQA
ncbi:enoyl-CoA hydratase/isomerase family protein [Mucilaginibacter xinganensis]|uniref:Enoyl-CoA hydratase n=1 Tax=Mucilaginibacter xinganensis TaxID=1234841 RepID=A0A223P444_9SPHI|nr:enoyl-CoA hydratase/isomerase family protein [Mucilaginibacter xinganensis]ASU36734.1 enoyl-CoA hydratase [Mucilaginibacter xinganensis]